MTKDSAEDILEILQAGEPPAVATDENHRVVLWNRGAERLLGRTARQALGRRCHDLLEGRDCFGNRFCYADCAVSHGARRGESVQPFELHLVGGGACGKSLLNVTTIRLAGRDPGSFVIVHLLQAIDESSRLARLVARLEAPPQPSAPVLRFTPGQGATLVDDGAEELTDREREVLGGVAAGLHNKEIAQALGISVATARNHIHRILEKLGVHSKLEALSLCVRNGWAQELPRPRPRPVMIPSRSASA